VSGVNSEVNKLCVRRHFEELWNHGNVERIADFFSPDFSNFGQCVPDVQGAVKYIVGVWRKAFPDLHFRIDSIIAEDDLVMCEVTFRGTHLGNFHLVPPLTGPDLPPTGKAFEVKHIHRFRLQNGKIVEHFAVRDDLGMFRQLGHLQFAESPRL
jgi:predicted ester cyclase